MTLASLFLLKQKPQVSLGCLPWVSCELALGSEQLDDDDLILKTMGAKRDHTTGQRSPALYEARTVLWDPGLERGPALAPFTDADRL